MRLLAPAGVWLKRALPLHALLHLRNWLFVLMRNLNSNRPPFVMSKTDSPVSCVTVPQRSGPDLRRRQGFGFSPKISTTVENTVENASGSAGSPFLFHFMGSLSERVPVCPVFFHIAPRSYGRAAGTPCHVRLPNTLAPAFSW
jgi:hypothetical protein